MAIDFITSYASILRMTLAEYLISTKTSQAAFAKKLGVSQGLVYQWISGKRPVSAEQCPAIERLTNGAVTCEELNDKVDWAYVRRGTRKEGRAIHALDPSSSSHVAACESDHDAQRMGRATDDTQPPVGTSSRT
ncbi:hypothetical protein LMG31506_00206 [Cupriavidus yeoncheonensis]|uniref:HTH cro/C1-type domain-containing protein n=1 Tax=Cupriavidus yeoncheonensis TaxID=1462994 RepID=A0A916IN70_9BURK|nr:helix-turn-helix domain-containing protein [Cupriavidus yeoncheonensis]CAG2126855.1 hypothetical protein LMG31506_00206 [Cupriavidus yeoncheonensis]